jgi:hypothetical protein
MNAWLPRLVAVPLCICLAAGDSSSDDAAPSAADVPTSRFVSVGELTRSVSKGPHRAPYVLLDEQRRISSYVVPRPGVNLEGHVGTMVALTARELPGSAASGGAAVPYIPTLLAEQVTEFDNAEQPPPDPPPRIALTAHQATVPAQPAPFVAGPVPAVAGDALQGPPVIPAQAGLPVMPAALGGAVPGCHDASCVSCGVCSCGPPGQFWFRGDYLLWRTRGMNTPPLVTTSPPGTDRQDAGVLGAPGTEVVFGDQGLFDDSRSGARFRIGKWCRAGQWLGLELEYFQLDEETAGFRSAAIGEPIFARPFFNELAGQQDSELVQFPGVIVGTVDVNATSNFYTVGPRFLVNLACGGWEACPECQVFGGRRWDLLLGYRYARLDDRLGIRERLSTIGDADQQQLFDLSDSFQAENDFHGFDLGLVYLGYRGRWSLEMIGRVALGNNRQAVRIDGVTVASAAGESFADPGGLLALESNIGDYDRGRFAVLPEFSASLGYALTPQWRFQFGYTILYWDRVVRAGDQIDLGVNPELLPPAGADPDPLRPAFTYRETSFWAQGLNLGLDYRW